MPSTQGLQTFCMFCYKWHISFKYYCKAPRATSIKRFLFESEKWEKCFSFFLSFFLIRWDLSVKILFLFVVSSKHLWKFPLFTLCHRTQYCTHFEQYKEPFNLMALAEAAAFLFIIIFRFSFILFKGSLELLFIEEYSTSQVGLILWQHYFSMLFLMYGT